MQLIYISLSIFLTFTSCETNDETVEPSTQEVNSSNNNDTPQLSKFAIEVVAIDTTIRCIMGYYETEFIIRNQMEYEKLLQQRLPQSDCDNYELPPIDFDKYILIGIRRASAGIDVNFDKQIYYNNQIFHVNYTITQYGNQERLNHIRKYYLIEKIGKNDKVVFNYTKKYEEN